MMNIGTPIPPITTENTTIPRPNQTQIRPFFHGVMPLPPSVNASYKPRAGRSEGQGGIAATKALEQFKRDAQLMLSQAEHDWSVINAIRDAKRKVALKVTIRLYFATEWKRDLDGGLKAVIDAAFARMQLDDRLVVAIDAEKLVDPIDPRAEIDVRCVVGR
jgi:Holliday junction resolvase RusA-like endonuclease